MLGKILDQALKHFVEQHVLVGLIFLLIIEKNIRLKYFFSHFFLDQGLEYFVEQNILIRGGIIFY